MIGAKRKWLSGSKSFSASLCCCVEYFFIFIFFPFFFVLGVGDKNVSLYVSFSFWANEENVLRLAVESYADNQTDNISKLFRTAERYSQAATFCKRRQNEALKLYRHSDKETVLLRFCRTREGFFFT